MLRSLGATKRWVARSYSHVGRRIISVEPNVQVDIFTSPKEPLHYAFGKTPISEIVRVSGPQGSLEFPVHHGLKVTKDPGKVEGETLLKVRLDDKVVGGLSKHCRNFVRSMWGTTTTTLRNNVEGVSEVSLIENLTLLIL